MPIERPRSRCGSRGLLDDATAVSLPPECRHRMNKLIQDGDHHAVVKELAGKDTIEVVQRMEAISCLQPDTSMNSVYKK